MVSCVKEIVFLRLHLVISEKYGILVRESFFKKAGCMSKEYAEQRIREALVKTNGNATRARQLVAGWCAEDAKLLLGLTRSHLTGIIAYNIDRVQSGRASAKGGAKKSAPQRPQKKQEENFGMELLKAVAERDVTIFGQEAYSGRPARGAASSRHIEAIHRIAGPKGHIRRET